MQLNAPPQYPAYHPPHRPLNRPLNHPLNHPFARPLAASAPPRVPLLTPVPQLAAQSSLPARNWRASAGAGAAVASAQVARLSSYMRASATASRSWASVPSAG